MPHPLIHVIVSQSDYLIQAVDTNSTTEWQTMQLQISWLLKTPTDLDLHCCKGTAYLGPAGWGLNHIFQFRIINNLSFVKLACRVQNIFTCFVFVHLSFQLCVHPSICSVNIQLMCRQMEGQMLYVTNIGLDKGGYPLNIFLISP